ncbi:MAG TPA: hypothetical protein VFP49_05305 [Nitrososphaeraceae archaeon]|nr:hypothetical protein [Nitrososphaeraceae archaeon]
MKKNNFIKEGVLEEYLKISQILEILQGNLKNNINNISFSGKHYKKLFYLVKRNNFLNFVCSIIINFTVMPLKKNNKMFRNAAGFYKIKNDNDYCNSMIVGELEV